jgi:hypothetical protein
MHTIDIDHAEPKIEVQVEQVQKVYGGAQATSSMDTNLALGSRQALVYPTTIIDFCFELIPLCYECLCTRLIGVDWSGSYIMNNFRITHDELASICKRLVIARRRYRLR